VQDVRVNRVARADLRLNFGGWTMAGIFHYPWGELMNRQDSDFTFCGSDRKGTARAEKGPGAQLIRGVERVFVARSWFALEAACSSWNHDAVLPEAEMFMFVRA
jgi:hypothetical protein